MGAEIGLAPTTNNVAIQLYGRRKEPRQAPFPRESNHFDVRFFARRCWPASPWKWSTAQIRSSVDPGARIVANPPEKVRYRKELKSYATAQFTVLADIDNAHALVLNVVLGGDEKREAMQAGGYDISPYQGNDAWMLPIPATFVVDNGVVKASLIDPDYRRRMDLDELLAALRSFIEPVP